MSLAPTLRRPHAPADRDMLAAVTAGDAARVLSLINEGVSPLGVNADRQSLLRVAVGDHSIDVAELLIRHGHPVDVQGSYCETPLHRAALMHSEACCRLLLDAGASVEAEGAEGLRPLHLAATAGSPRICKLLLDHGATPNAADSRGHTPLMRAVQSRSADTVKTLLEHGALPDGLGYDGAFPLKAAIENNDVAICELLAAHGADMHRNYNTSTQSKRFDTALHFASVVASVDVGKVLVRAGMTSFYVPDSPSRDYLTPFQLAVNGGNCDYVTFYVEECGEDLDQITAGGRTVWELAQGDQHLIGLLNSLRTDAEVRRALEPVDEGSSKNRSAGMSPL